MEHQASLCVVRLNERARLPEAGSAGAAGLDLSACLDRPVDLAPGSIALIPTGIALAIPNGYEGQVRPRSGLACRHGVTVVNAPGTIDSDYRGEVKVGLINLGQETFTIEHAMRIAQVVIAPVASVRVEEVEALDVTARGSAGFGSTGLR